MVMGVDTYQLDELIVCELLDPELLVGIEKLLMERREAGEHPSTSLQLTSNGDVLYRDAHTPLENFKEIAAAIKRFQIKRAGLTGTITMHGAIVPYQLEPAWHSEVINDSFVVTTKGPTEGLSGNVPGRYWAEAALFVLRVAEVDPEFTNSSTVNIVHPPLHSLLHIPYGAYHRSPVPTDESPKQKLIVNATVLPSFMPHFG